MPQSSTDVMRARGPLRNEMASGDLGDARLNARRNRLMTVLEQSPEAGFPAACGSDSETEALYRFLRNRRVSLNAIVEPHLAATAARCRAVDAVLVIHDTTEMSFPGVQTRTGLTQLGTQRHGFWCHAALAVSADGLRAPLGLLGVAPFARSTPRRKMPWRERFRSPGKESRRWAVGVSAVRSRMGNPRHVIHVMDREADSYELLAELIGHGDRCVVRVHYDRQVVAADRPAPMRLSDLRAHATAVVERTVTVAPRRAEDRAQRLAHPARDGRVATVSFGACQIVLQRPRDHRSSTVPATLAINVVFGWEAHPPAGEIPVEWWLVTTEPVDTTEDVLQIVEWYRTRWLIEEFFKCLKTGCAYEKRQLESFDTLLVALGLFAPIAWQLLLMRHLVRERPDTRATVALTPRQIAILRITPAGTTLVAMPSIRDALLVVARLGGHLRQNGDPGWLVLTRGMRKLRDMEIGWAAAERARKM